MTVFTGTYYDNFIVVLRRDLGYVIGMTKLRFKVCGCGKVFKSVPQDARVHLDPEEPTLSGYYWNCDCRSTLFVPLSKVTRIPRLAFAACAVTLFAGCGQLPTSVQVPTGPSSSGGTLTVSQGPVTVSDPGPIPTTVGTSTPLPLPTLPVLPTPTPYAYTGSGTQPDPYQVSTPDDFQNITQYPTSYFTVMKDIDMTAYPFQPEGDFAGTIYGNLHAVGQINLVTTGTQVASVFNILSGDIVQLRIGVNFRSDTFATAFAYVLSGLISDCNIEGTIVSPDGGPGLVPSTKPGNSAFTFLLPGGAVEVTTQSVLFNGGRVNFTFNILP